MNRKDSRQTHATLLKRNAKVSHVKHESFPSETRRSLSLAHFEGSRLETIFTLTQKPSNNAKTYCKSTSVLVAHNFSPLIIIISGLALLENVLTLFVFVVRFVIDGRRRCRRSFSSTSSTVVGELLQKTHFPPLKTM